MRSRPARPCAETGCDRTKSIGDRETLFTSTGPEQLISGTGAYKGLRGKGKEKIVYDPDPSAPLTRR
jgi:hypothetical protein